MSTPLLATKLYLPPAKPEDVRRPRLIERLNKGLHRKLTLISAPAGFGKTTLISEWVAACNRSTAWLSLDAGDNDPTRFLNYLVAALQTIDEQSGQGVMAMLRSPQPPPIESILTTLLNDISSIPSDFLLVLDDYHIIDSKPADHVLTFLLEHLPTQMHLVIATREDPDLPIARFRARGQLSELRASDLRFIPSEAAEYLNQVMGLELSAEDIAALETRTEGWIAGLHLAALAIQGTIFVRGNQDASTFVKSFTGSHHFVLDYLVEEVLKQQPKSIQSFLLATSILDRLCGSLCDAVLLDASTSGQENLEYLDRANLFVVSLDNERHWYRYHHLFGDFLRQRLYRSAASSSVSTDSYVNELHVRASQWFEENGLLREAFHHAAAANDIERAARLIEGEVMPLHFQGEVGAILSWLEAQPQAVLDARPSLWVIYASVLLFVGQMNSVEAKVRAAEAALQGIEPDEHIRDLIGHIASIRATLAVSQYQVEVIIAQSHRALEYLHPNNLPVRTATIWSLGFAYHLQGDRVEAVRAYTEAIAISETIGHHIILIASTIGLGMMREADNQLHLAAGLYQRALQLAGDTPMPVVCEAHLGLARIFYEWNDLQIAEQHGQKSLRLGQLIENSDRIVSCGVILARLRLAQGDVTGAAAHLLQAEQQIQQNNFVLRIPEVVETQIITKLHQHNLVAAAELAQTHELPLSRARVYLAQGDTIAALAVLDSFCQQMKAKSWQDEQLKAMVLQALALHACGEEIEAVQRLEHTLRMAEPGGFIRLFVDEGAPMRRLLSEVAARGNIPDYIGKMLAAFEAEHSPHREQSAINGQQPVDALSQRELEILRLIAQGLSNREISERLFLALSTVKGHTQRIFDKLQVQRRTEAVARARKLGLL